MSFPTTRMRRLRRTEALRRMVREARVTRDDLVQPLFVVEGQAAQGVSFFEAGLDPSEQCQLVRVAAVLAESRRALLSLVNA